MKNKNIIFGLKGWLFLIVSVFLFSLTFTSKVSAATYCVRADGAGAKEHEMQELEKKLKEILGTEVKIDTKGDSGKIVISFYSPEEVYGIVNKINSRMDL